VRLFAAVFPPPPALETLHDVVRRWRPELSQLTWVAPELWHVTLAFYGEVPERDVDGVRALVEAGAHGRPPLRLQIAGGGCFPERGDPRVLWAGVAGDLEPLSEIARAVAPDDRPFHPHLTLARVRRRPAELAGPLASLAALDGPAFTADEVVLMHSEPGRGGSPRHYTPLATYPLGAVAAGE
jgi:2'-5' RNA ligase